MIEFFHEFIPPNSTAQQRRFARNGATYLPSNTRKAQAIWRAIFEQYRPASPLGGALEFRIVLYWPHTAESKRTAKKLNITSVPKTTRPDDDNLLKLIKDAMTKCGYWHDDSQTYKTSIERYYSETSGVYVKITRRENHV